MSTPSVTEFGGMQVIEIPNGPDGMPDADALIAALTGITPWKDGDALPHLTYTDPPGGLTPAAYESTLKDVARSAAKMFGPAEGKVRFAEAMAFGLGEDLVEAHGVVAHKALPAVIEFAAKVWGEVYPDTA